MKITTKQMVMAGLLLALSAVLSQFPIMGSIGLDAMPAFFGAVIISPVIGGLIGLVGHLLIAMYTGFPLTLPAHLLVGSLMFLTCYIYGVTYRKFHYLLADVVAIFLNGPVALLLTAYFLKILGAQFSGALMFMTLLMPLTITSAVNVAAAQAVVLSAKYWLKEQV